MRALASLAVYSVYAVAMALGLALLRARANGRFANIAPRVWVVLAAAFGLGMFVIAEPLKDVFQDFFTAYYTGGVAVLSGATGAEQLYAQGVNGFVNAPIGGVPFVPLALLPGKLAGLVYLALGVMAAFSCWRLLVRVADLDSRKAMFLGFWMLANGPLLNSLKEGNSSHFALWAIAAAMLYVRDGKDARAGMLLAAISLYKLPLVLFFVWAGMRGRWRMVIAGGALLAGIAATSIICFGWDVHVAWYGRFVASTGRQVVAAFNNQSFPALFARFQQPLGALCNWDPIPLDRVSQLLTSAARVILLGVAVVAAFWRGAARRDSRDEIRVEMAMVAILSCLFSPLAWSHYYCWALLAIALLSAGDARESAGARLTRRIATVLVSLPVVWPFCTLSGVLTLPYSLFVSHYILGSLLLFGLLAVRRAGGLARRVTAT